MPTFVGSWRKQGSSRKTSISASFITLKLLTLWITINCRKFLKEMGIPDHFTYLLRNLYEGQEAKVRTGQGTAHWFKIGKRVCQDCILSPCWGPASAGSRGTLGMNGVGERERREPSLARAKSVREREKESDQMGGAAGSGNALFFTVVFIP